VTGKKYGYKWGVVGVERLMNRDAWGAVLHRSDGSRHRVTSKFLPACDTEAEAQAHLDAWARKNGLDEARGESPIKEVVQACEASSPTPGREIPPGGLVGGAQYFLRRRDKPDGPFRAVEYRGMTDGFHAFYSADSPCLKMLHPLSSAALPHYEIREYAS
jgi:hypothetical protein